MKYLLLAAVLAFAFCDHVIGGGVVGVGGYTTGLTDFNHDGIPDQYEGWNRGWGNHWGNHWGGAWPHTTGTWGHHYGGLTDWNHDGIPDQYEGWNHGWGNGWGNHWGNNWNNWW